MSDHNGYHHLESKRLNKIGPKEWDEVIKALHDLSCGHDHDGVNSKKLASQVRGESQILFGSSPQGLEFKAADKRRSDSYGSFIFFDPECYTYEKVYLEVCAKTDSGQVRVQLFNKQELISEMELPLLTKSMARIEVEIEEQSALHVKIITDKENTSTIWHVGLIVCQ